MTNEITIFETCDSAVQMPVIVDNDTVWLSLDQMTQLFDRNKSTVSRHIKNVFEERELQREAVVAKYATTATDGKTYQIDYYNLDVIISVGYRVKSQRGTEFRQWANRVLRDYILKGYSLNQKRLESLNRTVEIESRIIAHLSSIETDEMLGVINSYTSALDLLDSYDHQCVRKPDGNKTCAVLTTEECREIIAAMKFSSQSALFGTEKEEGKLDAVLGSVYQSVFGEDVYPSIEEKAASLLYFLVKDHPFNDGCKRIAATLFLTFLQKNGILRKADGTVTISNGTLAALTLLIAESKPEEKEIMVRVTMNILRIN
jgi:prophage maintenance system killer protein